MYEHEIYALLDQGLKLDSAVKFRALNILHPLFSFNKIRRKEKVKKKLKGSAYRRDPITPAKYIIHVHAGMQLGIIGLHC